MNSDGCPVWLGREKGGVAGDTGLPTSRVYYCGRRMNQCRCGSCDGQCGPTNGCPCNSCRDYLSRNVLQPNTFILSPDSTLRNSDGSLIWKGGLNGGTGAYYCGRKMNQCRCGRCDGQCGPTNGCPCNSCKAFLSMQATKPVAPVTSTIPRQPDSDNQKKNTSKNSKSAIKKSSDLICVICSDAPRKVSFIHGGTAHKVSCVKCAENLGRNVNPLCPACQLPINGVLSF